MQLPRAERPRAAVDRVADAALPRGQASTAVSTTLVGIGVPSKYFDLALSLPAASVSAVTLKRARRLTPQQTK